MNTLKKLILAGALSTMDSCDQQLPHPVFEEQRRVFEELLKEQDTKPGLKRYQLPYQVKPKLPDVTEI